MLIPKTDFRKLINDFAITTFTLEGKEKEYYQLVCDLGYRAVGTPSWEELKNAKIISKDQLEQARLNLLGTINTTFAILRDTLIENNEPLHSNQLMNELMDLLQVVLQGEIK